MRFFIIVLLTIFLQTLPIHAQYSAKDGASGITFSSSNLMQSLNSTDVKGTPYYDNEIKEGKVYLPNNKKTEVLELVINLEEDVLLFKEADVYKIFNPAIIKGIEIYDEYEQPKDFFVIGFSSPENDITTKSFLRVVYNGNTKILVHHSVDFDRGNFRDPVTNRVTAEYKKKETYYIVRENGEFKKTRLRLKNLVKDIGEFEKELKDFAKKNKIKGKSESDAFRILEYYDSLKEENS
ncbi:MAG: hypothetical protein JJ971_08270 [Balneolaceae bacterium]|nr:hypothetical protein [Balneolaceae bacterium]MBO6546767.1 hypothetical protein [Balneolaceae bacterium]MBO6649127.1 hypothetical protein [Balneolaceae bacterium]